MINSGIACRIGIYDVLMAKGGSDHPDLLAVPSHFALRSGRGAAMTEYESFTVDVLHLDSLLNDQAKTGWRPAFICPLNSGTKIDSISVLVVMERGMRRPKLSRLK
jgi:hypothetical protein